MKEIFFDKVDVTANSHIYVSQLDENDELIDLTIEAIFEEKNKNEQSLESNVKASYVSSWYSHTKNNKFIPIVRFVEDYVYSIVSNSSDKTNIRFKVMNCWGAIYDKGDFTIEHNHFPCNFSVVVYLDMNEGCSNIFFGNKEVEVKKGTILVFPSFIPHHVPKTNTKRVVVAMNLMALIPYREKFDHYVPVGEYL